MKAKVSCHIITYNQINYISECIDGMLMQQTNFPIEIVIGDDVSTDGTRELLIEYYNKYPDIIRLNLREVRGQGLPGKENFMTTLAMCTGEYIALCDGDDYWTDPLKLQKQVDFLEANPDYVIHSANAIQLSSDPAINEKALVNDVADRSFVLEDFLSNNNLVTCTVMYRNIGFQFPEYFDKVNFGDWFIYVILMSKARLKAYRSIEVYAVYRIHDAGIMINLNELNVCNTHISQIITINKFLQNKSLRIQERDALNFYFFKKYSLILKQKKYFEALKTLWNNFKYCKFKMPLRKYLNYFKTHFFIN